MSAEKTTAMDTEAGSTLEMDGSLTTTNQAQTASTNNPTINFRRIAPRTSSTTTSSTATGAVAKLHTNSKPLLTTPVGQIVVIQKPGGTMQQIRISSGSAVGSSVLSTATATTGTPTNIQLIKTTDGNFIQIKNNSNNKTKPSVLPQLQAIGSMSDVTTATMSDSMGQNQIANGATRGANINKRIMIANRPNLKLTAVAKSLQKSTSSNRSINTSVVATTPTLTSSTPSSNPSVTLTVAQAQKMGLISSAKLKELVSQATAQKQAKALAAASSSSPAMAVPVSTAVPQSNIVVPISTCTSFRPISSSSAILGRSIIPTTTTNVITSTSMTPPLTSLHIKTICSEVPSTKPNPNPISAISPQMKSVAAASTNQKILIQTADGTKKQVVLPPHLYRLAQQGQIKAVSIAGKGIHYVRVHSNATNKSTTTATMQPQSDIDVRFESQASNTSPKAVVTATGTSSSAQTQTTDIATPSSTTTRHQQIMLKQETQGVNQLASIGGDETVLNRSFSVRKAELNADSMVKRGSSMVSGGCSELDSDADNVQMPKQTKFSYGPERQTSKTEQELQNESEGGHLFFLAKVNSNTEQDPEGPRRKHCNCTKSQCLKLYCDCFANGEFCQNCNCKDCFNNLTYEEERQKAIKMCLERNPHAFKPKIGKGKDTSDALRRHNKGCNCKRSGCLKNYCECYEAKIVCSENCKCIDCHNVEGYGYRPIERQLSDSSQRKLHVEHELALNQSNTSGMEFEKSSTSTYVGGGGVSAPGKRVDRSESPEIPPKIPCNFMTQDVIEATIQCVVAQADECQKKNMDSKTSEMLLLEEFGRCLLEIIDFSMKNHET